LVAKGKEVQTRERFVDVVTPQIRIVVRVGTCASGQVIFSGTSETAPSGSIVVAWPEDWKFTPRDLAERIRVNDPGLVLSSTDEAGRFEVCGLGRDTSYSVTAVAPGWCDWPPSMLQHGEGNVLVLECIMGIRVRVQESGGAPIRSGLLRTYGRPLPFRHGHLPGAAFIPIGDLVSELLGSSRPPACGDPTLAEILFACEGPMDALGPISFQVDIPGYLSESVDLWALPTNDGLQEWVIEAIPTLESQRDIRLVFANVAPEGRIKLATRAAIGQVVLLSGTQEVFADIEDLTRPLVLRSIPRSFELGSVSIQVGESAVLGLEQVHVTDQDEEWRADAGGLQALVLEIIQPDESLYRGPALVLVGTSEEAFGAPVFFDQAPYVLFSRAPSQAYVLLAYPRGDILMPEASGTRRRAPIEWP
jgi:hypothetical protein